MKSISLYLVSILALLLVYSCYDNKSEVYDNEQEPGYERKTVLIDLEIKGYPLDTIICVPGLTSHIDTILNESVWFELKFVESDFEKCKLEISCDKNNTAFKRTSQLEILFNNKDTLKLTVSQNVVDGFDDIHDIVSDQALFAPQRVNPLF